ncbi:MAG: HlyD family efflux transporter periplasmic adaptor subunit [Hyphomicrobium sp.]
MIVSDDESMVPRLDVRFPCLAGAVAVAAFIAAGLSGAIYAPFDKSIGLPGKIVAQSAVKSVAYPRAGSIAQVNVSEGQHVAMGDVLLTLNTQDLQEQIAALKAQSEAAVRQLDLIRAEAATSLDLLERKLAPKSRVLQLQRQVEDVTKEAAGLTSRIAMMQAELDQSAVRAPIPGKVLSTGAARRGAAVQPGAIAMEIVPDDDHLVVEGRLTPQQAAYLKPGMAAKVWLSETDGRDSKLLPAKLAWISSETSEDSLTGQRYVAARVELDQIRAGFAKSIALRPGMRAGILLMTGQRTVLGQLADPLMRRLSQAYRG